jgi:HK97 family phage major capsid protein
VQGGEVVETDTKSDAMINRLEREIAERDAFIQGTIANAQDVERDLTSSENELVTEARKRIEVVEDQLDTLRSARERTSKARQKAADVQAEMQKYRHEVDTGPVEYRSAGAYVVDQYEASRGGREALERLEIFHRAAAHQKTSDNLGIVPDPIVGSVIRFIDDARPMVTAIGPQSLTAGTWYRPIVTQEPLVAKQGAAGLAADEKSELVSQKMLITRLTANAVTYGGYVNVSRQDIDFTNGQAMDLVIQGLASNYAIQTEAAVGTALDASTGTPVGYGASPTAVTIRAALWSAAATVYTAVKGQGRLVLALAPDRLAAFGPLFTPIPTAVAPGEGLVAGEFGSGQVGGISGITAVMSAGLASTKAFLFSTAAMEVFEQRVGTLSVTEPSVLGVQVGYAGYFTPLLISNNGIIELTAS